MDGRGEDAADCAIIGLQSASPSQDLGLHNELKAESSSGVKGRSGRLNYEITDHKFFV